jgi:ABC-2 type transport system permease protein
MMIKLKRIFAVFLRQYYLLSGSPTRLIPIVFWVGMDVVLWGFITRFLSQQHAGFNYTTAMLGAVVLWGFLVRVIQGVTMAFLEDAWSRNFLNVFASPITTGEYVAGLVLSSIATSLIGLAAMLVIALAAFGFSFSLGAALLPLLLVLFLFGIALGIAGAALVLRFGPAAEWLVWPIPALISPFVGVFYPLAVLPGWMQPLSHALPPSYVFESLRALMQGQPVPDGAMLTALALSLAYIGLLGWVFARVYRFALKTGLIARYSAESAG